MCTCARALLALRCVASLPQRPARTRRHRCALLVRSSRASPCSRASPFFPRSALRVRFSPSSRSAQLVRRSPVPDLPCSCDSRPLPLCPARALLSLCRGELSPALLSLSLCRSDLLVRFSPSLPLCAAPCAPRPLCPARALRPRVTPAPCPARARLSVSRVVPCPCASLPLPSCALTATSLSPLLSPAVRCSCASLCGCRLFVLTQLAFAPLRRCQSA